ncbi:MAG TPA: homoserine O-acetyltransferase, partial [Halothiobacillaceae bacterium]|nr:homoserine O-acetyltransferase [Halothiobacillaceae bacterium]
HEGRYMEHGVVPRRGLMLARMLGHITYLSDDAMRAKFGRELRSGQLNFGFDVEFQVESYLRYQGTSFVDRFDANTYLLMTKALDYFDPAGEADDDLAKALANVQSRFLVVSFTSDWRFSPERSKEIVRALLAAKKRVSYAEVKAHQGHDAFLMPIPYYHSVLGGYLDNVANSLGLSKETA